MDTIFFLLQRTGENIVIESRKFKKLATGVTCLRTLGRKVAKPEPEDTQAYLTPKPVTLLLCLRR